MREGVAPKEGSDLELITMAHEPSSSSVILAVGDLLKREVDLDELLERIVRRVADALEADRGTLYLVDGRSGELVSRAAQLPELKQIRLKVGQGVAGSVAATGKLINLVRAEGDKRFFREIDRQTGYTTRSMMAAPLIDRTGAVIGVVQVLNARGGKFDSSHEESMRRLCAEAALAVESTSLYPGLPVGDRYNRIVGESPQMARVYALVRKAAATNATVLLRGESGTGKELIARAIHYNSARREGPFVKVDCTAIPPTLIENELFGHERGAYTGADRKSVGRFEAAEGGTLFLDELGELPLEVQAKLLRFLQDREFERVGGNRTQRAVVRVVAATHRDLEAMVGRGQFRDDLYYRVKVVQVGLPPLRERGAEDIARLALHFVDVYRRKHGKATLTLSQPALHRLSAYRWPGNIRELEHAVESAVVLCESEVLLSEHFSLADTTSVAPVESVEGKGHFRPRALADVERDHILKTLDAVEGNRSRAAKLLGIGRNTLQRKLAGYRR